MRLYAVRLLVLLAAGLAVPASAVAQAGSGNPDQMEAPEVRELRITGVRSVDRKELEETLATEASGCLNLLLKPFCLVSKARFFYERHYLDRDELSRDVLRVLVYYFRRGYREAVADTVITDAGDNAVRISINVTEGPATIVASRTVTDSGGLTARDMDRFLRPEVGEPLDLIALDSSMILLRGELWERGYANAELTPVVQVDDSLKSADVRLSVAPGTLTTIGEIRIVGNRVIDEEDIRHSLLIKSGDLFRRSTIGESQRALYESNFFRRAVIDTVLRDSSAARDSVKTLVISVQEAPLREARLRAGFTTADFALVDARFTHNYWLGGARRLDLNLAVGNLFARQLSETPLFADISNIVVDNALGRYYVPTYQASADVRQRWFGSPRNTVGAGVFTHRRSSPGVFVDDGYGVNTTFTRRLAERTLAERHLPLRDCEGGSG